MALNLGPLNVLLRLQGAEKFKRETKNVTGGLGKLGAAIAGLASIRAVSQQFVQATQVFAEFERGMVRVGAVTNSLGTQAFAGLTERAQDLAKTTEFTARQVSDAMGFMGMAGMKTNQIFEATPAVLQLASAGMVDVASAADTVTNIMAGYGLKTEDLNRANNVLVATFTNSNTSLQQLGQSFKYVGPVAKSAGVKFKEAAAVIGLMGNAGIQADMAGTALRGTIIKLLDPTAEGAKIMRQYGINVQDSNGKLKPMVEIFRQLEPIADDSAKMIELFGLRAGPGMQAALTQGTGALERLIEKIDGAGNIAERIAKAQMETLDGKIKIMKSNFEGLQIAIGDAFSETTQSAVEATSGYIADLTKTVKELSRAADGASGSMFELGTESNTTMRNMIRAVGASLGFGMEGVTPSESLTGEYGKGAQIIAERAKIQQKIIDLSETQNNLLRRGSAGISDYGEQIAKLVAQLNHYDQALKNTGRRLRQAVKPAEEAAKATEEIAPKPKRSRTIVEQIEGAAGVEAVQALFEGLRDKPVMGLTPMSSKEFDAFMQSFEPDIIIDYGEATRKATEQLDRFADDMKKTGDAITRVGGAVISGRAGATFGPEVGSMAGAAIAGAISGGAAAPVGGAIGGLLGGLLGDAMDELVQALQVLTPIFDLFADILKPLQPIFVVMREVLASFGSVLKSFIVPLLNTLVSALMPVVYISYAIMKAFEPLSVAIGTIVNLLIMLGRGPLILFGQALSSVFGLLGGVFNFGKEMFNGLADAINSFFDFIRNIEVAGVKPFAGLTVSIPKIESEFYTLAEITAMEIEARDESTKSIREFNEELSNVPIGVKRLRGLQFNATRGAGVVPFPGMFNQPAF